MNIISFPGRRELLEQRAYYIGGWRPECEQIAVRAINVAAAGLALIVASYAFHESIDVNEALFLSPLALEYARSRHSSISRLRIVR